MTVTDLTLIYLSVGAPIAVYETLQKRGPLTPRKALSSVIAFLVWPAVAFRLLLRYLDSRPKSIFFGGSNDADIQTEQKIDSIREDLKSIAASELRGSSVFEFREFFDRYVELTLAINPKYLNRKISSELFRAGGREETELAEICLNRRNRAKLSRHQTKARESFLEYIDDFPDRSQRSAAAEKALELAFLLNDGTAAGRLDEILKSADETENVVWNSDTTQHIQTVQLAHHSTWTATELSKTD